MKREGRLEAGYWDSDWILLVIHRKGMKQYEETTQPKQTLSRTYAVGVCG